jgi:hypothetical protein
MFAGVDFGANATCVMAGMEINIKCWLNKTGNTKMVNV